MEILTLHIHEINSKAGARIVPEALDYFQCDYNEFIVDLTKLLLTYKIADVSRYCRQDI